MRGADCGDEQSETEGAHQVEGGAAEDEPDAPPDRDIEPEDREERDDGDVEKADDGEGDCLADDELPPFDRGNDDLFHRADLFFPDNGHAGEHHGGDQHHHRHDSRDVIVATFQVVVEPGPAGQLDRAGRYVATVAAQQLLGENGVAELLGYFHRITQDDAGRVWIRAVHDYLQRGGPTATDVLLEAMVDPDHCPDRSPVQQLADFALRSDPPDDIEITGMLEPCHQVAAGPAVVQIVNGGGDVLDVGVHRIAEQDDLNNRHGENDEAHLRVAEDLNRFLD